VKRTFTFKLSNMLGTQKFGPLPERAKDQVHRASAEQLDRWARRLLRSTSLEDTLD